MDKQTWRITGHGTIKVQYATYWDEVGPFATQLNAEHAFINPAMILLYVPERRSEEVQLGIDRTCRKLAGRGPRYSGMESMGGPRILLRRFESYDALADAPIEAGKFEEFQLAGVTPDIRVVVHGDNWKKKKIEERPEAHLRVRAEADGRGAIRALHVYSAHWQRRSGAAAEWSMRIRRRSRCLPMNICQAWRRTNSFICGM